MNMDRPAGNVLALPCGRLAALCADAVYAAPGTALAVTMDAKGWVWVESAAGAAAGEIVGVYHRGVGVLALTRSITEDLAFVKDERGIAGRAPRAVPRRSTSRGRVA